MREEMIRHFARQIEVATSEKVPGSDRPDGSYISRSLMSSDAAHKLAVVIASMIEVAMDEKSAR